MEHIEKWNKKGRRKLGTYLWVIGHLKPYRMKMIVVICCGLIASAGELVTPMLIQRLIDVVIPEQNKVLFFKY